MTVTNRSKLLNQREVEQLLGVGQGTVSKWLKRKRCPIKPVWLPSTRANAKPYARFQLEEIEKFIEQGGIKR